MNQTLIDFEGFNVKPSYSDIKRRIKLPTEYSEELAYFCGILAGDGHIEVNLPKKWNRVYCAGNPADEKDLYFVVLLPLIKRLFNIEAKARPFSGGTFGFEFGSKLLVSFLTQVLKLPKNNKYNQLRIPDWVKQDKDFLRGYIRGLADTDFCLSLKKRYKSIAYYPVISGCSKSRKYMEEIAAALDSFGFKVSRSFDVVQMDSRFKKGFAITHMINIYGHTQLIHWMKTVGFCSPKHLMKFEIWRNRNIGSNRLKVKEALKEASLLKNRGLETSPLK
jgi:hypothetical protein